MSSIDSPDKERIVKSKHPVIISPHSSEPIERSLQLSRSGTLSSSSSHSSHSSQSISMSFNSEVSFRDHDSSVLYIWLAGVIESTPPECSSFDWSIDQYQANYDATDWQSYHDYYLLSHHWPHLTGSARCRDLYSIDELHMGLVKDMNMEVDLDWLEYRLSWVEHRRLLWPRDWVVCRRVMDWLEDMADVFGEKDSWTPSI